MMKSETRKSGTKNKSMIYKEVLGSMEIRKPAVAGTLESSDCQVTVEPGEGNIEFALESAVINQYGNQIKRVVMETLENLGVKDVRLLLWTRALWTAPSGPGWKARCSVRPDNMTICRGEVPSDDKYR